MDWWGGGFISAPGDTPALAFYEPRILEDIEIGQSAADALAVGGRVALTVSEIALADGDDFSADLARYGVADGRAVRLLSLPVLNPRASDFGTSLAAASLPEPFHRDPADRLLVAQARADDLLLLTSDRSILAYAEAGHVRALAC
jgi:hypothetical protein